ncbi:hypothetical protein [Nonomuraea basaltis]|uniref:hypothetical protein n=1 Tax=Nonomuraea basaltis TaxID=2495887 RepID=UPI00110C5EDE|nr:hypothetical protein [Nonomuraea basaltis]TMR94893.1 hypothetical protein EJK15_31220 [Nonomuraea basaltis]
MNLLEQRYRNVLRLLPASYRAGREEEMVAAFMEMSGDAPSVGSRPGWGEIASVLALSVRVRFGAEGASPRAFAWGETVRLVALLGLAYQMMNAAINMVMLIRALASADDRYPVGPGLSIGETGAAACSAVAFMAIMRGSPRLAKTAALLSTTPTLVYFAIPLHMPGPAGMMRPLEEVANALISIVPVIALLLGFHRDVAPLRRSWRLTLSPLAAALMVLGWVAVGWYWLRLGESKWLYLWLDELGMLIVALVVGAAVAIARRREPSWPLALSAIALLLLLARLPMMIDLFGRPGYEIVNTVLSGQAALLAVLIGTLGTMGLRSLPDARATLT